MLVLRRREGEVLEFSDERGLLARVTVGKIKGRDVSLAIEAPAEVRIARGELVKPKAGAA